jgi:hypothetical protein
VLYACKGVHTKARSNWCTPFSPVRERERKREKEGGREIVIERERERKRKRESESDREKEGERERCRICPEMLFLFFKRNDRCLVTF